ncbi:MAG: fibronectin type III domain-containing protein [Opitutus sp.]
MRPHSWSARLLPRFAFAGLGLIAISAARGVQVTVDPAQVVRTVDDRTFGVNTAVWDGTFSGAANIPLLQAIDIRALRFPGGSLSDEYHWKTNTTLSNTWTWSFNFDTFATAAVALNTRVFITVNYGTGTVQEAVDWVTYSNVTKGYGFKYWEIGNENYGTWETDTHPVKNDPYTYAVEAQKFIAGMKAVDPTIKIGVVLNTGEDSNVNNTAHPATNPRTNKVHNGWTPVVLATLKSLGVVPDFAIYHRYDGAPGQEADATLLQKAKTWPADAADLRQQLTDYLGSSGSAVELVVTENNSVYSDPGKQSTSLVNGLFLADSVGNLLQTEFNALLWWDLRNGQDIAKNNSASLYGWRNYGDYGILSGANDPYPTYYIMKLLSRFARGGDQVVKTTSDDSLVSAFGVRRANGTLTLLVINKSPTVTASVNVAVTGYTVSGTASVYSYGISQDEAARTGSGSKDVALASLSGVSSNFQTTFPPYSASVVVLLPVTPGVPTQLYGYASGSSEVTLTWQLPATNSTGISSYKLERATNAGFSQGLVTLTLGSSMSYVDASIAPGTTYYYRVAAANDAGTSAPSTAVQINPIAGNPGGPAKLVNIATRAYCSTGNNVTIGGFVVSGSGKKSVLIRAVGPSLTSQGLTAAEVLSDPVVEVHDAAHGNVILSSNDNWGDNSNASQITALATSIGAAPLLASDSKSSTLLLNLDPGVYSFVVSGKGATSGIVLLEVYDADAAGAGSAFVNIASRADGVTGNGVAIGGFVIAGSGLKHVLIRAVGPTLSKQGLSTAELMSDPVIELHDAGRGNVIIATNDNWSTNANRLAIASTGARIGAMPLDQADSASSVLLVTLPPGVYSFVASGKAGSSGILLVEVYDAD